MNWFRIKRAPKRTSAPPGKRAYAIGDVHGCLDELRALLDLIERDRRGRVACEEYVIFLGDLVDRGPDTAGVLDFLIEHQARLPNPIFLMGNHEEMMLHVIETDGDMLSEWITYGGGECLKSYGVNPSQLQTLDRAQVHAIFNAAFPRRHLDFIGGFGDSLVFGDYLFVHAGIRPGVPLEKQRPHDLRWIRDEFLQSTVPHKWTVVHGHTISDEPDNMPNRIGVDTGAYRTGVLTAVRLEGDEIGFLQTAGIPD